MKVTGMLFNDDMVRALLSGKKTQTRRPLCIPDGWEFEPSNGKYILGKITSAHPKRGKFGVFIRQEISENCGRYVHDVITSQYGGFNDLIYVREAFCSNWHHAQPLHMYLASDDGSIENHPDFDGWTPSIHMPLAASRLTLVVKHVRIERLHDISEEDARAEGIITEKPDSDYWRDRNDFARSEYAGLWNSLYGNWDQNPWVWVYGFNLIHSNVDSYLSWQKKSA